mgnify:CR=1 FL=1
MSRTYFITGGTGFVGRALVRVELLFVLKVLQDLLFLVHGNMFFGVLRQQVQRDYNFGLLVQKMRIVPLTFLQWLIWVYLIILYN